VTDDVAGEVVDELRVLNEHMRRLVEALDWFNLLQDDRKQLAQETN
jgi:hypothetical protein